MAQNNSVRLQEEEKENLPWQVNVFYWLQAMLAALLVLILAFTFLGRLIVVKGSSMENTLQDQDYLLVQGIGYTPGQGDIVIINPTYATFLNGGQSEAIVKRVIAVGGQHVQVDYSTNTVYVDGTALDEDYIREPMIDMSQYFSTLSNIDVVVPEGSIFVMGDNRNNSTDSRDVRLGTIDTQYVLGRALCVVFPFADITVLN